MAFLGIGKDKKLTPEQAAVAQSLFLGTDPNVAKAYGRDPRTALGNDLISSGMSTAPVAGGYAEGIARALSGLSGGYIAKQQQDKYKREDATQGAGLMDSIDKRVHDAAMGGQGMNPGMDPTASLAPSAPIPGMAGPQGVMSQQPPPAPPPMAQVANALTPQQGAPVAPALAANPPLPGLPPVPTSPAFGASPSAATLTQSTPALAPTPSRASGVDAGQSRRDRLKYVADTFDKVNTPIEGGVRNGVGLTSPAGAQGLAQIMPGTGPEAARLAGFDWDAKRNLNDPVYSRQLGIAYLGKQYRDFGNMEMAHAAYNAGPGRVRQAIRQARKDGGSWQDYLPAETKNYIQKAAQLSGEGGSATPATAMPEYTPVPVPDAGVAPPEPAPQTLQDRVRSTRLGIVADLLDGRNDPNASMSTAGRAGLIREFLDKGLDEDQASKLQRDQSLATMANTRASGEMQTWGEVAGAYGKQPLAERSAAIEENYKREDAATLARSQSALQSQQDVAAGQRADTAAAAKSFKKPPTIQVNAYLARRSLRRTMGEILQAVQAYPDSVNWTFDKMGNDELERVDGRGVKARAAIGSLTGNILHNISGAAVSPTEAKRLMTMLPSPADTPKGIRDKVNRLALEFQGMDQDARTLFQNADGTSMFDALEAQDLAANPAPAKGDFKPGAGPTNSGVDYSKFSVGAAK